jgi:hypothetical protein
MNIYYRFHYYNFYDELKEGLKNYENFENNKVDKLIMSSILTTPFEFYQALKGSIPKWIQFHFMDILFDLDSFSRREEQILDEMTLRNYDYLDFLNYLLILDVGLEDSLNYASLYDNSHNTGSYLIYLEKIVVKNVIQQFKKFENGLIKEDDLKNFLKMVLNELNVIRNSMFIINSVCKVSKILIKIKFFTHNFRSNLITLFNSNYMNLLSISIL